MEKTEKHYDVIFTGNYTKDTIITPAGTSQVDGGGMNYAAHAGKALGLRGAVVTRLAKEDQHVVEMLRADGIDCYPVYSPSSTLMTLEYKTLDVDKRDLYVTHTAGTILPEHLDGLAARAIAVSPSIRGEVEPAFFHELRQREGGGEARGPRADHGGLPAVRRRDLEARHHPERLGPRHDRRLHAGLCTRAAGAGSGI